MHVMQTLEGQRHRGSAHPWLDGLPEGIRDGLDRYGGTLAAGTDPNDENLLFYKLDPIPS